jgi:hypothetical protein
MYNLVIKWQMRVQMTLDEFEKIMGTVQWYKIGRGGYNTVYCTIKPYLIEGQNGYWVRKAPLKQPFFTARAMSDSQRAVRKWNTINPNIRAWQIGTQWIVPYVGNVSASDLEIACKVVQIYQETGIIVADAYGKDNFLKFGTEVVCVDVDYALSRRSIVSELAFNNAVLPAYDQYAAEYVSKKPLTVAVIKTLFYLESQFAALAFDRQKITYRMVKQLHLFRIQNAPILITTLDLLETMNALVPESTLPASLITPKMILLLTPFYHRRNLMTAGFIFTILASSIEEREEALQFTALGIGWPKPHENHRFFQSLPERHECDLLLSSNHQRLTSSFSMGT